VEHKNNSSHSVSHEDGQTDDGVEPITIKRIGIHEKLAKEMNDDGVSCEALPYGSHQLERKEAFYSYGFALSSRIVTNKGLIRIVGKNIGFAQILQRN